MSAPQIGDVISTAEELDALPDGTVILSGDGTVFLHDDDPPSALPWASPTEDSYWTSGAVEIPAVILYLPGQPPRPERVVKAEALREAQKAWGGNWGSEGRDVMFNVSGDDLTPQGRVGKWLGSRADRIERGEP